MPCYHPFSACRKAGGGISFSGAPRERLGVGFSDWFFVPCGSCVGCLKSRARDWAIRCSLELQFHSLACWATLTYSDDFLPPTLDKRHLQLFLKRLRARLPSSRVRFFASGEYGERTFRPHYHPILYGTEDEKLIKACWPYGRATMHELRPEGIAYVAGYVNKKIAHAEDKEERIDYRTGEVYTYQPPFLQMSRKPGIGGEARQFLRSWRDHAFLSGTARKVPRFLHKAWADGVSFTEQVELACEQARKRKSVDWDRLAAGEVIAKQALSLSSEARTL